MAIPDKNIKSNPQGPGTQGPNQIAARDARARKERAGGMKRSGGGSAPVKRASSGRPGRETTTEGQARYDSAEDRWARMTGTGRYDDAHAYDRMTGTGSWADGGGAEARLNRQRMFGQADMDARYRAGGPARRERALGGMADFRQESAGAMGPAGNRPNQRPGAQRALNSFGGRLASSSIVERTGANNRKSPPSGTFADRFAGGLSG